MPDRRAPKFGSGGDTGFPGSLLCSTDLSGPAGWMVWAGLAVRCVKTRVACTGDMDGWGERREGGVVGVGWLREEWDACLNWDVLSELAVCIKSLRYYADGKKTSKRA